MVQDGLNETINTGDGDETTYSMVNHTTVVEESPSNGIENHEPEQDETDPGSPGAESTQVEEEQDESTEADRMTVVRKQSKVGSTHICLLHVYTVDCTYILTQFAINLV